MPSKYPNFGQPYITHFPSQLDINMERKIYFSLVLVVKGCFPFLYLKLGFACDTKETVIRFDSWQAVVFAAFEPARNCVKVPLLCEECVLVFFLILLCARPCNFLLFSVLFLSSSGAVWWTSQQVHLIHWIFHWEPICFIWFCFDFFVCFFVCLFFVFWYINTVLTYNICHVK